VDDDEMNRTKTIGVLGGMGPMASVEFYRRLVANTKAQTDQDHLHILIDNDPSVPNRTDALLDDGPCPVPALQAMARRLESAGAELLAMPCNTAHAYIAQIRAAVTVPVLDMIEETAAAIDQSPIGLLATRGTIETELYQGAFAGRSVEVIVPVAEDQTTVMDVIARIKAGETLDTQERRIAPVVERLAAAGAMAAIAACTELSLLSGEGLPIRWIDALDILVRATLRAAGGQCVGEGEESE
jgi:aspartate racemase